MDGAEAALRLLLGVLLHPVEEIGEVERAPFARVDPLGRLGAAAEAVGIAGPEDEHGQALVPAAMRADQLALVEMRDFDAVDRARKGAVADSADGIVHGDVPGDAEALSVRPPGKLVGAFRRKADAPARLGDAAAFGQRPDEAHLPLGRPAVAPVAQRHRIEAGGLRPPPRRRARGACLRRCRRDRPRLRLPCAGGRKERARRSPFRGCT